MGAFSEEKVFGMTIRESADDGSDFSNPDADYRRLFLGEDGQLHVKDSAGSVTDIGTGSAGFTTGTSMPGSPSTNDLVFRTDIGMFFQYDGTRWLCTCRHQLKFGNQQAVAPWSATTALRSSHPGISMDIWALTFWADTFVATTSSGTQYWTIALDGTGVTLSTISNAANAVVREGTSGNVAAVIATGTNVWITLTITKVSTPGTLFADPILDFRFIGT